MSDIWVWIFQVVQVVVATAAVLLTPSAGFSFYNRIRGKLVARCLPVSFGRGKKAETWTIVVRNRSSHARNFDLFLLPENPGNRVARFRLLTKAEGGLACDAKVEDGVLAVHFRWLFRKREARFMLQFERPDFPAFDSSIGVVARSFDHNSGELPDNHPYNVQLRQIRLIQVALMAGMAFLIVIGRLVYLALRSIH